MALIYSVNFMELTEKINPHAFSKYLKDTGWNLFSSKKHRLEFISVRGIMNFFK